MGDERRSDEQINVEALKQVMYILGELKPEGQKRIVDTCVAFYDLGEEG